MAVVRGGTGGGSDRTSFAALWLNPFHRSPYHRDWTCLRVVRLCWAMLGGVGRCRPLLGVLNVLCAVCRGNRSALIRGPLLRARACRVRKKCRLCPSLPLSTLNSLQRMPRLFSLHCSSQSSILQRVQPRGRCAEYSVDYETKHDDWHESRLASVVIRPAPPRPSSRLPEPLPCDLGAVLETAPIGHGRQRQKSANSWPVFRCQ